jgi:hypothetical protein
MASIYPSFPVLGSGTVTSVSVATANGISGTVALATTTPEITLNIAALDATKIGAGGVTSTEFGYIGGLTSDAQTQLNSKGAGSILGVVGTVDNAIVRANGTGGLTAQGSGSDAILEDGGTMILGGTLTANARVGATFGSEYVRVHYTGNIEHYDGVNTILIQKGSITNDPVITWPNATGTVMLNPATTQGDMFYYNGTAVVRLPKGTAGQTLKMNAGATAPEWV